MKKFWKEGVFYCGMCKRNTKHKQVNSIPVGLYGKCEVCNSITKIANDQKN